MFFGLLVECGLFELLLREDVSFVGDLLLDISFRLAIELLAEVRILLVFAVLLIIAIVRIIGRLRGFLLLRVVDGAMRSLASGLGLTFARRRVVILAFTLLLA